MTVARKRGSMARCLRSTAYLVAMPLAFGLAVLAGRATRLAGGEVALVWPAAAVAVIWLLAIRSCGRRERALHVGLLGLTTVAMNIVTGASLALSLWFVLVNVSLAVVTVGVLTYRRSEVALRDPADLGRLLVALTAGTCSAALVATAFLAPVTGAPVGETFALFAVRNGASALLGVAIWLRLRDVTWSRPRWSPAELGEALLYGIGVGFVFVWVFWWNTGLPMAFLPMVPAILLALRYSTTVSTLFLAAAGVWIVVATLLDRGVFIVAEMQTRALLAQAMVCSLTVVVLTLALYRDSRARLIGELRRARDRADRDSELLAAVLDSIHDSVILVDPAGDVVLQNARAADTDLVNAVVSAALIDQPGAEPVRAMSRDVEVATDTSRVVELTVAPLAREALFRVMAFRDVTHERRSAQQLREARDLFAGVLQAASEQAIIGTDPGGRITVFNNGAERLLGWTESEMIGAAAMDFHLPAEVAARAKALSVPAGFDVLVHNVRPARAEVRQWTYVRRNGTHATVSLAVSQMTAPDGSCAGYICVATDITDQKAAEQALAESEERFRLAFDTAPMGMFMFEAAPRRAAHITRCNHAMADILGCTTAEVLGMTVTQLVEHGIGPDSSGLQKLLLLEAGQSFEGETQFRRADGTTVWGAVSASVVSPGGSRPYGICLVEDITSRKRAEAELQYLALHDPLTGLANRALLLDRARRALSEVAAGQGAGDVGLIFLDLDGFKAVNDTWGHAQGDHVLEEVARRIEALVRDRDTVARLGGDEFAVLCPGISSVDQLRGVAERIRADVRGPVALATGDVYDGLSVSAGVVTSRPGWTAETLLQRGDALMYDAKRAGKDSVTIDELGSGDRVTGDAPARARDGGRDHGQSPTPR
ncbi:diguanylate cyclase domain-containing protein [Mycobacterium sp. WMMD1722]|uniref:diguanylate cyclase domain-containing protein n=1 Tax=Mycobacterium sp. WMMD1722 TaxID=3404117 RepID=UPI003BF4F699